MRLSQLSWLVIAAVAVAGELAVQFAHREQLERFVAPVRNLPPFRVLSAADIRPLWGPASRVPRGALMSTGAVLGHISMTALPVNKPITAGELGPLAGGRAGSLAVVGVPATAAMALDGQLAPGETIGVWASGSSRTGVRTRSPTRGRVTGYIRVLVLAVSRSGTASRPYVILVAIPRRTPHNIIAALGAGAVTLVSQASW